MAEFQWWLLIVGLVFGAGLTWLVLADSSRREVDVAAQELASEAAWIAARLAGAERDVEPTTVEAVLREHRLYLSAPPPDEPDPEAPRRVDRTISSDAQAEAGVEAGAEAGPDGRLETAGDAGGVAEAGDAGGVAEAGDEPGPARSEPDDEASADR